MKYLYDGTFEGLLTVVFDGYKVLDAVHIGVDGGQLDFFETIKVTTDFDKAKRVAQGVEGRFGKAVLTDLHKIFLSKFEDKDDTIGQVIYGLYHHGPQYLQSAEHGAIRYREIVKNYTAEAHSYKGLLRFMVIQDGVLYAPFEPENDLLVYVTPHFIRRMPNESFLIHDVRRSKAACYAEGRCEILHVAELAVEIGASEQAFQKLWKNFYDTVAIPARYNPNLMQSNMPKRYWRYLPEKKG
ncbi:TIGR03915 family putative DNA repair protein [Peptoniphilus equinus]|uniref:TIGR03915 family putative DNA repair protein n=1 Tax=Peptoniphilus equinus TaxID=3016343 RepID=A0ABY7QU32_9FIRM|nr:TIGR03915 family putative DNA repair protein [Peptoniphilus equinus]WBW49589.1 TIGR03915 family putative DNA repair protein [Peptoniphilus equinus]